MPAEELIPNSIGNKNCDDGFIGINKSQRYDYIIKPNTGDSDYPVDSCPVWYHGNAQIDNLQINGTAYGNFQGTINQQSWKGFDIKHPSKPNHRLRHICLEGPEAGVYYRGRLTESNVIELPDYWSGLIDPETITVSLTQIGCSQDLIVDKIEWGKRVIVKSGMGTRIDCYFVIHAARIDGEKLVVEYEGQSPSDYPGDPSQYSISGYDYGRPLDKDP